MVLSVWILGKWTGSGHGMLHRTHTEDELHARHILAYQLIGEVIVPLWLISLLKKTYAGPVGRIFGNLLQASVAYTSASVKPAGLRRFPHSHHRVLATDTPPPPLPQSKKLTVASAPCRRIPQLLEVAVPPPPSVPAPLIHSGDSAPVSGVIIPSPTAGRRRQSFVRWSRFRRVKNGETISGAAKPKLERSRRKGNSDERRDAQRREIEDNRAAQDSKETGVQDNHLFVFTDTDRRSYLELKVTENENK